MLGQITTLLTDIRDELRDIHKARREWMSLQTRWRIEDEQRRREEDSAMKRYLDLMQEANKQEAQPIDKQAIYNEMERERKARARDRKAKEEETNNG